MTKNEKDIGLLQQAIVEKWIPIWKGREKDRGGSNCSVCQEYPSCLDCPLYNEEEEGSKAYNEWDSHYDKWHKPYKRDDQYIRCPECKRLTAEMVRELRRVRDALVLEEERKEEGK